MKGMVQFEFDGLVEITAGDGKMTIGAELATRELLEIAYEAVDAAKEIEELGEDHKKVQVIREVAGLLDRLRFWNDSE